MIMIIIIILITGKFAHVYDQMRVTIYKKYEIKYIHGYIQAKIRNS